MSKRFLLITTCLVLAGCTDPVGFQDFGFTTPALWTRLTGGGEKAADLNAPLVMDAAAKIDHQWWTHFSDPVLDQLIAQALASNQSLAIAKARVEEARANRGLTRSALLPQLNGVGSASRSNQGYLTNNQPITLAEADLSASWELDLFGRNQARLAQATALLESQEASQNAVRVGLLAEVARSYFEYRNEARQIVLPNENLETQKKTLELIETQRKGALASEFDVSRTAAQVASTEALVPALESARDAAMNRINILLGVAPGTKDALLAQPAAFKPLDHSIVVAAPASVLAARPDIVAAERSFAATISAKEAATRQLFPDISLTALFGAQSAPLFTSNPWSLGASLTQPILNFGRIQSQIDAADAQQTQAFLSYQQTVLGALEDMENALSYYIHESTRNASLTTAVEQSGKAAELARQAYTNGDSSLLDVLVSERDLLAAQSAQSASDTALRQDLVSIYSAAGGGWQD
jgi:multidrug efflux system outer membrane protein